MITVNNTVTNTEVLFVNEEGQRISLNDLAQIVKDAKALKIPGDARLIIQTANSLKLSYTNKH